MLLAFLLLSGIGGVVGPMAGTAAAQDAAEIPVAAVSDTGDVPDATAPETATDVPADAPPIEDAAEDVVPVAREYVVVRAFACPSADSPLSGCEAIAGVTISVVVGIAELSNGPLTTKPNSIGSNSIEFLAPVDKTLTLTQIGGVPAGYGPVAGSDPLVALVTDLPNEGCGGESLCRYASLINVPLSGDGNDVGDSHAPPTPDVDDYVPIPDVDETPVTDTLTVYNAICPSPVAPAELFAACYDSPGVGVPFRVGRPNSEFPDMNTLTDAAGFASFPVVGAAARIIQELPIAGEIAVYCTIDGVETAVTIVASGNPALGVADVALGGGGVRCDWYNIPLAGGQTPDDGAANDAASADPGTAAGDAADVPAGGAGNGAVPVTALPSTGAGAVLAGDATGGIGWLIAVGAAFCLAAVLRRSNPAR